MLKDRIMHLLRGLPGSHAGGTASRPRDGRDDKGAPAPLRRVETRPSRGVLKAALTWLGGALLSSLMALSPVHAYTTGDRIINTATFVADGAVKASATVGVTLLIPAQSSISFWKYAAPSADGSPAPGASLVNVAAGSYRTGSDSAAPFAVEPPPQLFGSSTPLDLGAPLPLVAATVYHAGEPIFVQVNDPEQNLERGARETLTITLTNATTGKTEVLRLTETGPDTGIFVGYINSIQGSGSGTPSYSGTMAVAEATSLNASYVNQLDGSNSTAAAAVVDPYGIVFDSKTGSPVDGATVTLFDVGADREATVYGDDGVSSFPATVVTGSTQRDGSGRAYAFPPGGFRFPFIRPGTYQLKVTPPAGYLFPTGATNDALSALPGGPFAVVNGSRGEVFLVDPGPALRVDLPVDAAVAPLWVQKSAGKSQVAAGDVLSYQIIVQNLKDDGAYLAKTVAVNDRLPAGFRYRKGSTRVNGAGASDPATSPDGRTLTFQVGDLAAKGSATISYVVEVGAGAPLGLATNTAVASTPLVTSNLASATVEVRSDFLATRSLILGRVYSGSCSEREGGADQGVPGVRIYLEDGSFVDTDKKGMFHFEGITPTSHVVQLDLDSIPQGYVVVPCEENSRFAGRSFSQFVDMQGGTMWRADFHLARAGALAAPGEHYVAPAPPAPTAQRWSPTAEGEEGAAQENVSEEGIAEGGAAPAEVSAQEGAPQEVAAPGDAPLAGSAVEAAAVEGTPVEGTVEGAAGEAAAEPTPAQSAAPSSTVTLRLKSAVQHEKVAYQVRISGGATPLRKRTVTIALPAGVAYLPGTSELDGKRIADPQQEGDTLSYSLGECAAKWSGILRFSADPKRAPREGELVTRAALTFDTESAAGLTTPEAENALHLVREEKELHLPEIVLHPHFPTFGAELADEDRAALDELARLLAVLKVEAITVAGHTDLVSIAPRSRGVYPNNTALSLARARSVGRYLMERLHLPPSQLNLYGYGEKRPVATNHTPDGRAKNRRVEIRVRAGRLVERTRPELLRNESGVKELLVPAAAAAPAVVATSAPAAATPAAAVKAPAAPAAQPTPASPAQGAHAAAAKGAAQERPKVSPAAPDGTDKPAQTSIKDPEGILSPAVNSVLIYPISGVRICLNSELTPRLSVDGRVVPADRIGFTMKDTLTGKSLYSYIGVDFGGEGEHTVLLEGIDPFGNPRLRRETKVFRSGEISGMRLKSAQGNVADGKTPVRLVLELYDRTGKAIPAAADLEIVEGDLRPIKKEGILLEPKAGEGERVHLDAQGNVFFEPVHRSGSYRTVLSLNGVKLTAELYAKPVMREWILVGLAEGTAGYNTVSGHMENLADSRVDDKLYENDRLAFFAKGTVKGEWLVTASYDTAKSRSATGSGLFQQIDPNTYYTLYADASQQQYDAASIKKLYLKIERDQFYALFGDYDTGLTMTELSRYSRRMNGVKAEFHGRNVEGVAFGSETEQSYVKDEIQGDGTSGLYRLSHKGIILNSDKVTIEVRDRFRSEIILSTRTLNRFTDYSIDFDEGTLLFKETIHSRDGELNPIFIVAEYEAKGGSSSITYGGRFGVKFLEEKVKAGVTYLHEGQDIGSGESLGIDTTIKFGEELTLRAEAARSEKDFGSPASGNAYLAELAHRGGGLDARIYFRQIAEGFGLGQQQGSEVGTRKAGAEAAYKISSALTVNALAERRYNLATGADGDRVEAKANYTAGDYGASLGVRHASDSFSDGTTQTSDQLTAGVQWLTLNKRLTLKVDRDQSIGDNANADFPTRTALGAEYKISEKVTAFAQQEFTEGANNRTNTTRAGVKSTPWQGGSVNSSMERSLSENSDRLMALFGLKQTWQITDRWTVDAGLDRSQTIKSSYSFNLDAPPASGSSEDFTAYSLGAEYKEKYWTWNGRGEVRTAESGNKWGVITSLLGEPTSGWGWSARLQLLDSGADGSDTLNGDLRLGLVYRPIATRWILLDRLDIVVDRQKGLSDTDSRRIVNNLNANFRPDRRTQLSLQYGAKYALEQIDGMEFSGYTDLMGAEGRYDLTEKWDVGVRGSLLHTWRSGQLSGSTGLSVGYNVVENAWVSLGYNFIGFMDEDFSASNYTAQGPYVKFRFKFDQRSVKDAVKWINQ